MNVTANTAGTYNLTVTNPDGGKATSTGSMVATQSVPTITFPTATNKEIIAAGGNQTFTITGTDFITGATVSFPGGGFTVVFSDVISTTQILVNVNATGTPNTYSLKVTNPDGGAVTSAGSMEVQSAPTITLPSFTHPEDVVDGTSATFNITGTGFVTGATVTISGGFTVNSVTFNSATSLAVNVTATAKGTYNLTVTNPDGGAATSNASMTATTSTPTITFPTTATKETILPSQSATFNITGTDFMAGVAVTVSGGFIVNSVTFTNSTTIQVKVTAPATAATGNLKVTNTDGGTVTSANSVTT